MAMLTVDTAEGTLRIECRGHSGKELSKYGGMLNALDDDDASAAEILEEMFQLVIKKVWNAENEVIDKAELSMHAILAFQKEHDSVFTLPRA